MEIMNYPAGLPEGELAEFTDDTAPPSVAFYKLEAYPLPIE
jgi:hypothetical protein